MTIIDYVIEDLERITQLASVPEQQRRIIGDQIGRLRMYQSSGMDSASIKAELAALQAKHERLLSICSRHPEHNYDRDDADDVYAWLDELIDYLRESEGEQ